MAVDKAEANTREWQRNSNEWRSAMNDKDKMFATKAEVIGRLEKIDGALGELKTLRDIAIGKASQTSVLWAAAVGLAGLVIGLIRLFGK